YRQLRIRGEFPDLSSWLVRFGLPPIVQSATRGEIVLDGPIANPTITVKSKLQNLFPFGGRLAPSSTSSAPTARTAPAKAATPPAAIPCLAEVDLESAVKIGRASCRARE